MEWEQGPQQGKDKSLNDHIPFNAAITREFESELQNKVNMNLHILSLLTIIVVKVHNFDDYKKNRQWTDQADYKNSSIKRKKRCGSFFFIG